MKSKGCREVGAVENCEAEGFAVLASEGKFEGRWVVVTIEGEIEGLRLGVEI